MTSRPGRPYPLGPTCDGGGVNFALFPSMQRESTCDIPEPSQLEDRLERFVDGSHQSRFASAV